MSVSSFYQPEIIDLADQKGAKLSIKSMLTGKILEFPAFIKSFSQSFSSTWSEEQVYGRMDPIATFQNTKRTIALSFDLPAQNISTAQLHLSQCDELAQFLYPGYIDQTSKGSNTPDGRVISRPPLVSIKYANLISTGKGGRQLGWLSGLEWVPALDMGMFVDGKNLYPKVISLSFTFNVLHQSDKGFGKKDKKSTGNDWLSEDFFGGSVTSTKK